MIIAKFFGSGARWIDIYKANRKAIGPDPSILRIGTVLILSE